MLCAKLYVLVIIFYKLMESMGWTIEQAMDALQIPKEERNSYLNMLKK